MFIQNQISYLPNHRDTIVTQIQEADEVLFVVAYVRENGIEVILDAIKNKRSKLLCSLDMGITQLSGIKKLLENNVEVKVYKSNKGTFHPKIWLFGKNRRWNMLIGSANLTGAALVDNVEASVLLDQKEITSNALMFFNYLWDSENSSAVTVKDVISLQQSIDKRQILKAKTSASPVIERDKEKINLLLEYTRSWIKIPTHLSKGISRVWRGWYIIPDQYLIEDKIIKQLQSYCKIIGDEIELSESNPNPRYTKLLSQFQKNSRFQRKQLKMSLHGLFVRQAKNYLIKLGWCEHPIKVSGKKITTSKEILRTTDLGKKINECGDDLKCVKDLYTHYFLNYSFNGLNIVEFTQKLLEKVGGFLTVQELDYFVVHVYNNDDLEIITDLINMYRSLPSAGKELFHKRFKSEFAREKEHTAKNVYGNYFKNIKYTIGLIGWCNGFKAADNFTKLELSDEN